MSRDGTLGALRYEAETASTGWAEDTNTFATRLPILGAVDTSGLKWGKIPAGRTVQLMHEETTPLIGPQGGEISFDLMLPGHGSSMAGAGLALTALETFLGYVFGNSALSAAAGTTVSSATDADTWVTAASGTFSPKSIAFVGTLGDGRGNGQATLISTHSGTTMQTLTELDAAPASPDVVTSAALIYPQQTAATIRSLRFEWLTANQCYQMHGCYPMRWAFRGLFRGHPVISLTFGVSRWKPSAGTFPTVTSQDVHNSAPTAAGSWHFQVYGTDTRQKYSLRDFNLTWNAAVQAQSGPGGVTAYQEIITAYRRHEPGAIMIEFVVDAETVTATPTWYDRWRNESTVDYQAILSLNGAASGQRVAIAFPHLYFTEEAVRQEVRDGINREVVRMIACADTSGTNDLTRAPVIIALA